MPNDISTENLTTARGFLACVLREAGFRDRIGPAMVAPVKPAHVRRDGGGYTAYSGGSEAQCLEVQALLGHWLGAPTITENKVGDMLLGRRAEFPGGSSLVYMPDRDGGISLHLKPQALSLLVEHVAAAFPPSPQDRPR